MSTAGTERPRRLAAGLIPALLLGAGPSARGTEGSPDAPPIESGVTERAETRLVQVEVSAFGPPEVIGALGPRDFTVKVRLERITAFELDRHCTAGSDAARPAPATYLLYFDQPHLTPGGRQRAIELGRELLPLLLGDGARAMIVSAAARLTVIHDLSADRGALDAALAALSGDRTQWDLFAADEERRVGRVTAALEQGDDVQQAIALARAFQREERWRTEKSLRRLAAALIPLHGVEGPKAVLYFADTLRTNAGEHYLGFFGQRLRRTRPELRELDLDSMSAGLPFDRLVDAAAAHGVRFYPVLAQGLVVAADDVQGGSRSIGRTYAAPSGAHARHRHAMETLRALAAETGGQAFVDGSGGRRIAEHLREDFRCTYVISFDPGGLAEDTPLALVVETGRPGVRLRTPGRLVVPSPAARRTGRLLSAFTVDPGTAAVEQLRACLTPTGFDRGAYLALLQVSVPPTLLPASSWSIGATLLARGGVVEEAAGSMSVSTPGVRLVLEREVRVPPGVLEIVAVAHEERTDAILSEHVRLEWPDPDARPLTFGPIVALQPVDAAFVRSGDTRRAGSLGLGGVAEVLPDRPLALLGLVCRDRRARGTLRLERRLIGAREMPFPDLELALGDERCAQVRDVIPAGTLAPGSYRYAVRVLRQGTPAAEAGHDFRAGAPPEARR